MQKICENCNTAFQTKDSRQKSCGKTCADRRRKINWKSSATAVHTSVEVVGRTPDVRRDLPAPEELPAPYAKRVYDMWSLLVGAGDMQTRIA